MATNKARFSLSLDDDILERVDAFKAKYRYSTRASAINALIATGLAEYDDSPSIAEKLESIRSDYGNRVLLEARQGLTTNQIDQIASFAEFLRSKSK